SPAAQQGQAAGQHQDCTVRPFRLYTCVTHAVFIGHDRRIVQLSAEALTHPLGLSRRYPVQACNSELIVSLDVTSSAVRVQPQPTPTIDRSPFLRLVQPVPEPHPRRAWAGALTHSLL